MQRYSFAKLFVDLLCCISSLRTPSSAPHFSMIFLHFTTTYLRIPLTSSVLFSRNSLCSLIPRKEKIIYCTYIHLSTVPTFSIWPRCVGINYIAEFICGTGEDSDSAKKSSSNTIGIITFTWLLYLYCRIYLWDWGGFWLSQKE